MINSVSSLSFRGEAAPVSSDIINAPSKFAAPMDSKPDAFEKAGEKVAMMKRKVNFLQFSAQF